MSDHNFTGQAKVCAEGKMPCCTLISDHVAQVVTIDINDLVVQNMDYLLMTRSVCCRNLKAEFSSESPFTQDQSRGSVSILARGASVAKVAILYSCHQTEYETALSG